MATKQLSKKTAATAKKPAVTKAPSKRTTSKNVIVSPRKAAKPVAKAAPKKSSAPAKKAKKPFRQIGTPATSTAKGAPTKQGSAKPLPAVSRKTTGNAAKRADTRKIEQPTRAAAPASSNKKSVGRPVAKAPASAGKSAVPTRSKRDGSSPEARKRLALQHMQEALARKKELAQQPAPWQLIPHRHEPSEKLVDGVAPAPVVLPTGDESDSHEDGKSDR